MNADRLAHGDTGGSADEDLLSFLADSTEDAARVDRIRKEIDVGFTALRGTDKAVSVFGSARSAPGDSYYDLACRVGARLAGLGFTVITGGGPGLMEAATGGHLRPVAGPSVWASRSRASSNSTDTWTWP